MSNKQSPYDYGHQQLINAHESAAINVGSTISHPRNRTVHELSYLSGVLLARLEGVTPPFNEGEIVRLKKPKHAFATVEQVIKRVHYSGEGWWSLLLEHNTHSQRAELFKKVPETEILAAA